ncbi:MAG: SOS response-associated peptidase [Phycisphaeraceae bacterium]|nr:SOS response-associated peptidase [Phycisphaeraceae bacterium]
MFKWKQLHRLMELLSWPDEELTPRYNVAPTQMAPAVRAAIGDVWSGGRAGQGTSGREGVLLCWGLIPSWSDDPAIGSRMINARAESVDTKPAFRQAFRRRRCLVPISGFYEWRKVEGAKRKQPFYIRPRPGVKTDGDEAPIFALAGLWERWRGEGGLVESFTIVTTEANDLLKPLHDRMPVILPREAWELWLDPGVDDAARLKGLLRPFDPGRMEAYPVGLAVNRPAHDAPDCIQPLSGGPA